MWLSVQLHSEVASRAQTDLIILSPRQNSEQPQQSLQPQVPPDPRPRTRPRHSALPKAWDGGGDEDGKGTTNATGLSSPGVIVD